MAELVVASGKPCVEWRELISAGRVEPLEGEEWMSPGPGLGAVILSILPVNRLIKIG